MDEQPHMEDSQKDVVSSKKTFLVIAAAAGLMALVLIIFFVFQYARNQKMSASTSFEAADCVERLRAVPANEQYDQLAAQAIIRATSTIPASFEPVPSVAHYELDGLPILWEGTHDEHHGVVVRDAVFADLEPYAVSSLSNSQPRTIGRYTYDFFSPLSERDMVQFLFDAQFVVIVPGQEAHICIVEQTDTETLYNAQFTALAPACGESECTGEEQLYDFTISIDRGSNTFMIERQ